MPRINKENRNLPKALLNRFLKREDGALSVEAMLILPLLFWSMFASYTYYDSYRQSAINIKGAYAVADVLSREAEDVNAAYINTVYDLLENMVDTRAPVSMRVTYLTYDGDNDLHDVLWSCVRGTGYQKWTDAEIVKIKQRLPVMPDNGSMILVETNNTYKAPFQMAFKFADFEMDNLVFTHPRVFDQIVNTDPACLGV